MPTTTSTDVPSMTTSVMTCFGDETTCTTVRKVYRETAYRGSNKRVTPSLSEALDDKKMTELDGQVAAPPEVAPPPATAKPADTK